MVCIPDCLQIKEMEMFRNTFSLVLAARSFMDFVVAAGLLKISRGPSTEEILLPSLLQ